MNLFFFASIINKKGNAMDMISFMYGIITVLGTALISVIVYSFWKIRRLTHSLESLHNDTFHELRVLSDRFDRISKTIREDYDRELRLMHEHFTSEIDNSNQRLHHTIDGVAKHLKIDLATLREDQESFRHELYNELISRENDEKEQMLYS